MTAADVYRNYVVDGNPASGDNRPVKADIRTLLAGYEAAIAALQATADTISPGTSTYQVLDTDAGSLIESSSAGGTLTTTLPAQSDVYDGFTVGFVCNGGNSHVIVKTDGNIAARTTAYRSSLTLSAENDVLWLKMDASGIWRPFGDSRIPGKQSIWIPGGAMVALTGIGTPPTGPSLTLTSTNKLPIHGLDFAPSAVGYAGFDLALPKSWDLGNISMMFRFYQIGSGTGNVCLQGQGACLTAGASADVAPGAGAANTVTAGGAAGSVYESTVSSFALGGTPSANCSVPIYVLRNGTGGTDTLNATIRLIGVLITYGTNADNDS